MIDRLDTPDDLYPFAEALVRQLVKRYQLEWDTHHIEDAVQELYLAGWQVWSDVGDVGLAKNRMASRQKNLLRDYFSEFQHEPTTESSLDPDKSEPKCLERDLLREKIPGDPVAEASVNEYLASLTERQRRIEAFVCHSVNVPSVCWNTPISHSP